MPLTLVPISHGTVCHGSRWTIADEDDLAGKVARLALGQARHVAAILTGVDKRPPATRADTAGGAIKLLSVPKDKPTYHRDGWVFQAISWIAAYRTEAGAVIRAPHMIHAHKGFDGFQLKLDDFGQTITAVIVFEDKATENPRSTIAGDVWKGIRDLESGLRMNELIPEAGDGEVEQRPIAQSSTLVEPETNRPDLLLFQRPLRTDKPAFVPRSKFVKSGIHRRVTHRPSPSGRIGQSSVRRPGKLAVRKCG